MSELPYTRQEMMAIAAGRELRDGELAIFGVGLSMLVAAGRFRAQDQLAGPVAPQAMSLAPPAPVSRVSGAR